MKREKFIKKRRWLISIILTLFLAMVLAMEQAEIVFAKEGKNVTQNWAAAAVFYDTQADETEMCIRDRGGRMLFLDSVLLFLYT